MGLMTLVPGVKRAFVPSHMFADKDALAPADLHIFYGTRVEDAADDLPKYDGYWGP